MGTLLVAALVLATVTAIIEIRTMQKIPFLQKLTQRFGWFGIFLSLGLAMMLGTIFGAAGLTAMIAGAVGTVMTQPYHSFKHKQANMAAEQKQKMSNTVGEFKATYRPLFKAIKWAFIILTSPIWIPVRIRRWWINNIQPSKSTNPNDYATAA